MQAAAVVSLISLMAVPFYVAFFYHGLASVSIAHIVGQALFQGVLISIISLYLITYAVRVLGSQLAALFSPLIPVLTTLLAVPMRLRGNVVGVLAATRAVPGRFAESDRWWLTIFAELGAVAVRYYERARVRAATTQRGWFAGLPVMLKDNVDVRGLPTQDGTDAFVARPAPVNGDVARLFQALGTVTGLVFAA